MSKKNSVVACWMFFLVCVFLLYIMGLQVSPSAMAVDLMKDLQISPEKLGLLSGFFYYSYTLMQIPSGLIYDRLNARWILGSACLICAIGALFFGLTEELTYACIGRLLLGLGSSFAFVGVLVISSRWFHASWFAFLAGSAQFLAGAGALVGAYPLAYFVNMYGWREATVALGVFGIILAVFCYLSIQDRPKKDYESTNLQKIRILHSLKILIKEPQNIFGAIYSFCTWGPTLIFAGLWGIPFFMKKYGITNSQAALFISWIWIGVAITSPFHGIVSDYLKRRKIVLFISALAGLIVSMILIYGPVLSDIYASIFLFIFGLASAAQILAFALIKENNPISVVATGMGFNNMAVVMGGAIFQPLVGFLMQQTQTTTSSEYSLYAYEFSLSIVPICFFIATIVALFFIKETFAKSKY